MHSVQQKYFLLQREGKGIQERKKVGEVVRGI
jgi:hypothetical protein